MNLLKCNLSAEPQGIFSRLKSCLRALSIPFPNRPPDIDYAGLNAALRRYEQHNTQTGNPEVTQHPKCKPTSGCKPASGVSNP